MTKVRLIGDVHGKYRQYGRILDDSPVPTIQVGDMGIGFRRWPHGEPLANPPYDKMVKGGHRFIRGNHDNPRACAENPQYIPDGTIEGHTMFVGGALSIDQHLRREDFSYWPTEELSTAELYALTDTYLKTKPEVMITHECPEEIAELMVSTLIIGNGYKKMNSAFASRTRQAFQSMWSAHSPGLWVFGHWHVPFDHTLRGTNFVCLPELVHRDFDI